MLCVFSWFRLHQVSTSRCLGELEGEEWTTEGLLFSWWMRRWVQLWANSCSRYSEPGCFETFFFFFTFLSSSYFFRTQSLVIHYIFSNSFGASAFVPLFNIFPLCLLQLSELTLKLFSLRIIRSFCAQHLISLSRRSQGVSVFCLWFDTFTATLL